MNFKRLTPEQVTRGVCMRRYAWGKRVNRQHHDWKHVIDYETFWILAFSAVVLGSGLHALFSISQSNTNAFP
jgi:hypothetical protein